MKPKFLIASILAVALSGGTPVVAQAPDRAAPPPVGPAPAVKLPQLQRLLLQNGTEVWLVEAHEVPVVQINLVIPSGTAFEPAGKWGVGGLAAAMLMEGAGTRSSLELADALDYLGADLNSTIGFDSWAIRLHVPIAKLGDALPLMADVAFRPTFPAAELERLRQQRLTGLLQAKDDASTIAAAAFARVLYGRERFGTLAMGTAASLKAITVDDLKRFYENVFRERLRLIVVGDVTAASIVPLLERSFGQRPSGATAERRTTTNRGTVRSRREIYLIDKPGAPQSQIRIGLQGVTRDTPDYFPITVMNTVLGGSFSSRLNMNLREDKGYTYGATSIFDMRRESGTVYAAAGVQTDKTSESLSEFFKELNGIHQTVPAGELSRSKNYVALRYPGGFETTADISRRLEDALVYGLGNDYFEKYVPAINAVTAGDVERVAREYVNTDRVAIVIVGDRSVIEPGIRALNLGPINVITVDEVFEAPQP
jgi:zinc protease